MPTVTFSGSKPKKKTHTHVKVAVELKDLIDEVQYSRHGFSTQEQFLADAISERVKQALLIQRIDALQSENVMLQSKLKRLQGVAA